MEKDKFLISEISPFLTIAAESIIEKNTITYEQNYLDKKIQYF